MSVRLAGFKITIAGKVTYEHKANRAHNRRRVRADSPLPGDNKHLVDRYGLLLRVDDQVRRDLI